MLAYMRKNANSPIVWLIIGAIALVFVFLGMGQPGSMNLVTVNGEEADFQEYQELVREASSRLGSGSQTPDADRYARAAAMSEQINRILVRQFGENLGLRPGQQALREAVAAIEYFQVDGRFSHERYQAALKAQRRGASDFENELRRNLTSDRAIDLVLGLARAYGPELAELFHFQEDQVRFDYIFLPDEDYKTPPKEEELSAYYARHQGKWRRPPQMTVQYVEIIPADFLNKVDFTEAELEDYHHQDRFQNKEEAAGELRTLLARRAAVNLLEDLLTRAEVNPDLADAARSLGLQAAESPAFTASDPPGFFEGNSEAIQRAFNAPLNRVATPFEGEKTLVLYVPRTRQESRIPPLDEVRGEVEQAWRLEAAGNLTRLRLESRLPEIAAQGWEAYLAAQGPDSPLKSGAGTLASRYALADSTPFEKSDPQAVTALAFSVSSPGQIPPLSLAGRLGERPGRFILSLAEYQAADKSRLEGPEGRTFEYFLTLNKSNILMQAWRLGLYEASKSRIKIPPNFLP